jgi:hypothetical protein
VGFVSRGRKERMGGVEDSQHGGKEMNPVFGLPFLARRISQSRHERTDWTDDQGSIELEDIRVE